MKRALLSSVLVGASALASAGLIGPTPYLSSADSPWAGSAGSFSYFHLANMESGSLGVPGVSASGGAVIGPGGATDSVDGDDGSINGSGTLGRSWFFSSGSTGVTWTFSAATLGSLPTHAGLVWTDGFGAITFEAWDQNGVSLGTLVGNHATSGFGGQTDEDRFYGAENAGGISRIKLSNAGGGIELDHLQYGANPVPEPATMAAVAVGIAALVRRRRANK